MKFISCILSFVLVPAILLSQNLVPNGSFELHQGIPKYPSQITKAIGWFRPSVGTPDYFNACAGKRPIGVPYNFIGYQKPRTGNGYAGFYLYESADPDGYREYVSTKLKSTLVRGKPYQVKFYVCLANHSEMAVSNIEVLFTRDKLNIPTSERIHKKPQLKYPGDIITDTANWVEISWNYVAKGNEQYITIGNFEKADKCNLKTLIYGLAKGISLNAYYYIDDVCVEEIINNNPCKCEQDTVPLPGDVIKNEQLSKKPAKLDIKPEQAIILENIFFETNASELLPASFPELNQLVAYMKKHPAATIDFSGYTDNTGREKKNMELSTARAKAVADYLEKRGIKEGRINYKGYGSANPVANNHTKEGRAKNRRVEFTIHLN